MAMPTFLWVAAIIVFFCGLIPGVLPWKFRDRRRSKFVTVANALGAGVFLGASLIHLLPDAEARIAAAGPAANSYPFAQFACSATFAVLLLVDQIIEHNCGSAEEVFSGFGSGPGKETPLLQLQSYDDDIEEAHRTSTPVVFVLLLALAVHSFLAGVGMAADQDAAVGIFIAILAHKSIAAFVLGNAFTGSSIALFPFLIFMVLFSLSTPAGIGVGYAAFSGSDRPYLAEGIALACASGAFLFVGVVELLFKNLIQDTSSRFIKLFMFYVGYAIFATLAIWT